MPALTELLASKPALERPPATRLPLGFLERPGRHLILLGALVLIGLGIRGHELSARSLWFDEAFCWRLTEFPVPEMIRRVGLDNHPPLYFLLLKGWTSVFGQSTMALRSLSVLLGGATIAGTYLFTVEALRTLPGPAGTLARRREIALFAAAAVALNVFQIRWAWETRMYTLGTALAVLSSWALFRALHAPVTTCRPWLLLGLFDLLFLYTHYYALFSILAQALFLAGVLVQNARGRPQALVRDPRLWHALLALCLVVVGWLPWVPLFLQQRAQVEAAYWTHPVTWWDIAEACGRMFLTPENASIEESIDVITGVVAAGLCAAVLVALLWRARSAAWYLFLAATTPLAVNVVLSLMGTQVFHARFLLFSQVFLLVGLAVVVGRLSWVIERRLIWAGVLLTFALAHNDFWQMLDLSNKPGARAAAAHIDSRRHPGELAVVSSPLLFLPMLYHTADRRGWYVFDKGWPIVHYEGPAALTDEDLIRMDQLQELPPQRVWAIGMEGGYWGKQMVPVPPEWKLKSRHEFPEVYAVQGTVVVEEYEIPPDSAQESK